jgi:hypothetical protein
MLAPTRGCCDGTRALLATPPVVGPAAAARGSAGVGPQSAMGAKRGGGGPRPLIRSGASAGCKTLSPRAARIRVTIAVARGCRAA